MIEIEHDGEASSPRSVIVRKAKDGPEGPIGAFTLETVVVGTDAIGADVVSCNIRPCESKGRGGPRRLKPGSAADKAAKELHELVNAERGEIAKGHARAPDGVRLIPLDLWRENCRRKRLSTGETRDVENRAFLRAVSALTDAGHIGEFDGTIWMLAGQRRSTGSRPNEPGKSGQSRRSVTSVSIGQDRCDLPGQSVSHGHPPYRGDRRDRPCPPSCRLRTRPHGPANCMRMSKPWWGSNERHRDRLDRPLGQDPERNKSAAGKSKTRLWLDKVGCPAPGGSRLLPGPLQSSSARMELRPIRKRLSGATGIEGQWAT